MRNSKRRISRWKMITIVDEDKVTSSYYPLDDFGRLVNRFQKSKPRNLNLLMNPQIALSSVNNDSIKQEITSDSEKSTNNDSLDDLESTEEDQRKNNINYLKNIDSISLDESNLLVSPSLIMDTQWCIDYVTTHLLA